MTDHLTTDQIATPLTDAAKFTARQRYCIYPGTDELVYADFARAQERDLAKLRAAIEEICQHSLTTTRTRLKRALAGVDWRLP